MPTAEYLEGWRDAMEEAAHMVDKAYQIRMLYYLRIEELFPISVRTYNCLHNGNIQIMGDLMKQTEEELLKLKGFGGKSLKEVKKILSDCGLKLNDQRRPGSTYLINQAHLAQRLRQRLTPPGYRFEEKEEQHGHQTETSRSGNGTPADLGQLPGNASG